MISTGGNLPLSAVVVTSTIDGDTCKLPSPTSSLMRQVTPEPVSKTEVSLTDTSDGECVDVVLLCYQHNVYLHYIMM